LYNTTDIRFECVLFRIYCGRRGFADGWETVKPHFHQLACLKVGCFLEGREVNILECLLERFVRDLQSRGATHDHVYTNM